MHPRMNAKGIALFVGLLVSGLPLVSQAAPPKGIATAEGRPKSCTIALSTGPSQNDVESGAAFENVRPDPSGKEAEGTYREYVCKGFKPGERVQAQVTGTFSISAVEPSGEVQKPGAGWLELFIRVIGGHTDRVQYDECTGNEDGVWPPTCNTSTNPESFEVPAAKPWKGIVFLGTSASMGAFSAVGFADQDGNAVVRFGVYRAERLGNESPSQHLISATEAVLTITAGQ